MIPGEKTQPLLSGLHWVRDEAAVVRQEGARRNGSERVLALENASLLEVLAGLLKCSYLLNLFAAAAAVDADAPVEPVPEAVQAVAPVEGDCKNMEEVLESRHLAVDKMAATSDQVDTVEEVAKVDDDAEVNKVQEVKSGKEGKKGKKNK